jgi:outer membrane protein, adhesin transport system
MSEGYEMYKFISGYFAIFLFTFCISINAYGDSVSQDAKNSTPNLMLPNLVLQILENHQEIKSFKSQVEQAKAQYSKSKSFEYPTIDITANGGKEKINKEYGYGTDTNEDRYNITIAANQLITDFGKTTDIIARSGLALEQAKTQLESISQRLMLEGITAYINVIKARERLKSALQSEARIKELSGIEQTLGKRK